jgi:hypothetical protein
MADTNHPVDRPVEGDGVSYRSIVWFVVVLTATTVVCQILVWVLLRAFQYQSDTPVLSPLADAVTERPATEGRVYPDLTIVGAKTGPQPQLLVNEPANLEQFRAQEDLKLTTYGWVDRNAGVVRIPVERAKSLLLERGLPVR